MSAGSTSALFERGADPQDLMFSETSSCSFLFRATFIYQFLQAVFVRPMNMSAVTLLSPFFDAGGPVFVSTHDNGCVGFLHPTTARILTEFSFTSISQKLPKLSIIHSRSPTIVRNSLL